MNRDLVKILGYGTDSFNEEEALDYIFNTHGQVVTINPEMISEALKNPGLTKIINNAELVIPDGIGIQIGLKILGHDIKRIAGIDFGKKLTEKFSNEGKTVAFIGAKPKVAEIAVQKLKEEISNLNVVYVHDGYFSDEKTVIEEIIKLKPDLILVALGSPKQEFFIYSLKKELPNAVMIGLGGSFDVWSGQVERAPEIWRNLYLEWLYRAIKNPERFKRIFPAIPVFLWRVLKERFIK